MASPALTAALDSGSIEHQWKKVPRRVKEFIFDHEHQNGFISVQNLVGFWSSPQNVDIIQHAQTCGVSWHLALLYLRLDKFDEARALTINGAFIHQCAISSIHYIKKLCNSNASKETIMTRLSFCTQGFYATESPEKMESFIQRYVPPDEQRTLTTFDKNSSSSEVVEHANQISNLYRSTTRKYQKQNQTPGATGTQMKLILVDDDASGGKRREFDILSSTTLKTVFTDYAEKRGVSLRSLRFSLANQPLFLSQIGKKSPKEVGMQDLDTIIVHDTSKHQATQEQNSNSSSQKGNTLTSKTKHRVHSSKGKKAKNRGKGKPAKQEKPAKIEITREELKIEHSKVLTKIHEELQPQLKQIRQRLNNLLIERSQPKSKSSRQNSTDVSIPSTQSWLGMNPCMQCVGGKAGKSHFDVQVGEIGNLYMTRKVSLYSSSSRASPVVLDLHGYRGDEALEKLDESLVLWDKAAMQGCYPFVIQVKIICGCGTQTLSQVVRNWIKSKRNVSNSPKKK